MKKAELDDFICELLEFEEAFIKALYESKATPDTDGSLLNLDKYKLNNMHIAIENFITNPQKYGLVDEIYFMAHGENISFNLHPRCFEMTEHHHSFVEMIYVYSGQCKQIINGTAITMNKGELCILDTNVCHIIEKTSKNDIIINCLMRKSYFDTAFLSRLSGNDVLSTFFVHAIYMSKDFNDYILFSSGENETIHQIMVNILCEYFDKSLCSDQVINSYLVILFSELLRIYKSYVNSQNYTALKSTQISDIILYIQNNYKKATLNSTAKHFNFHPGYLSMTLKKLAGTCFIDLLHQTRLKKVCVLLETTNITINEIVNDVGYSNIHFFYKLFKKYYGCTPAQYRKNKLDTTWSSHIP